MVVNDGCSVLGGSKGYHAEKPGDSEGADAFKKRVSSHGATEELSSVVFHRCR
jgi:hypothetical protein